MSYQYPLLEKFSVSVKGDPYYLGGFGNSMTIGTTWEHAHKRFVKSVKIVITLLYMFQCSHCTRQRSGKGATGKLQPKVAAAPSEVIGSRQRKVG